MDVIIAVVTMVATFMVCIAILAVIIYRDGIERESESVCEKQLQMQATKTKEALEQYSIAFIQSIPKKCEELIEDEDLHSILNLPQNIYELISTIVIKQNGIASASQREKLLPYSNLVTFTPETITKYEDEPTYEITSDRSVSPAMIMGIGGGMATGFSISSTPKVVSTTKTVEKEYIIKDFFNLHFVSDWVEHIFSFGDEGKEPFDIAFSNDTNDIMTFKTICNLIQEFIKQQIHNIVLEDWSKYSEEQFVNLFQIFNNNDILVNNLICYLIEGIRYLYNNQMRDYSSNNEDVQNFIRLARQYERQYKNASDKTYKSSSLEGILEQFNHKYGEPSYQECNRILDLYSEIFKE